MARNAASKENPSAVLEVVLTLAGALIPLWAAQTSQQASRLGLDPGEPWLVGYTPVGVVMGLLVSPLLRRYAGTRGLIGGAGLAVAAALALRGTSSQADFAVNVYMITGAAAGLLAVGIAQVVKDVVLQVARPHLRRWFPIGILAGAVLWAVGLAIGGSPTLTFGILGAAAGVGIAVCAPRLHDAPERPRRKHRRMSARALVRALMIGVGAPLTGAAMFFTAAAARVVLDGVAGGSTWGVVGLALVLVASELKVDGPAYVGRRTLGACVLGGVAAVAATVVATDAIMVALCAALVCLALGSARRTLVGWAGHRAAGIAAVIWAPAFLGYGVGPLLGITGVADAAALVAGVGVLGTIAVLGLVSGTGETTESRDGAE